MSFSIYHLNKSLKMIFFQIIFFIPCCQSPYCHQLSVPKFFKVTFILQKKHSGNGYIRVLQMWENLGYELILFIYSMISLGRKYNPFSLIGFPDGRQLFLNHSARSFNQNPWSRTRFSSKLHSWQNDLEKKAHDGKKGAQAMKAVT